MRIGEQEKGERKEGLLASERGIQHTKIAIDGEF